MNIANWVSTLQYGFALNEFWTNFLDFLSGTVSNSLQWLQSFRSTIAAQPPFLKLHTNLEAAEGPHMEGVGTGTETKDTAAYPSPHHWLDHLAPASASLLSDESR